MCQKKQNKTKKNKTQNTQNPNDGSWEKCCRRRTSPASRCAFLSLKWSPLQPPEPASWPTQRHSTREIKTNFMIVVQIINSLAGFPSKMKAHLFSEVYNLVVNVSFGPKHPRLDFCLERIIALLEKNGLRVVLPHPSTLGTEVLKLACSCFPSGRSSLLGRTRGEEAGGPGAWTGCPTSQVLVHLWGGQVRCWPSLMPVSALLDGGKSGRLGALFPARLGFSSRSLCPHFIYLFKNHPTKIHPKMTNIWRKAKSDSFQGSWADHTYVGPEFGLWCIASRTQMQTAFSSYISSFRNNSLFLPVSCLSPLFLTSSTFTLSPGRIFLENSKPVLCFVDKKIFTPLFPPPKHLVGSEERHQSHHTT